MIQSQRPSYACCKLIILFKKWTRHLFYSHGYGSYVGKFAFYAKIFQEQGFDVIGMDFKGFGHSEGLRGFIEDRADFYEEGFDFV